MPTTVSLPSTRHELLQVSSPMAMPRTITVSVWVAALPPMLATTVMSAASATTSATVAWNSRTTSAATVAVTRFTPSHGSRLRHASHGGVKTCSSAGTPARRRMSSVASSLMTSMTSSTVMMPASRFSSSTTGIASRL